MCTVSFFQNEEGVIITSNRDENLSRSAALAPHTYDVAGQRLSFPKDTQHQGTWFCVNNHSKDVGVLLNGAATKHVSQPPYRRSRGLVVLDLFSQQQLVQAWHGIDLDQIEPFTLVVFANATLYQWQWNGSNKTTHVLPTNQAHIWSSATLYSPEVRQMRQQWFSDFVHTTPPPITASKVLHFHTHTQAHNRENGLLMQRQSHNISTQSVTQYVAKNDQAHLTHLNVLNNELTTLCIHAAIS